MKKPTEITKQVEAIIDDNLSSAFFIGITKEDVNHDQEAVCTFAGNDEELYKALHAIVNNENNMIYGHKMKNILFRAMIKLLASDLTLAGQFISALNKLSEEEE